MLVYVWERERDKPGRYVLGMEAAKVMEGDIDKSQRMGGTRADTGKA